MLIDEIADVVILQKNSGTGLLEDINGDCVVNVLDLIELLLCFGQPPVGACALADINADGAVNVLDLVDLLLAFGAACP